ncbi:MAG: glycosyltransferase [Candidatus Omnitrophota bacterium]
MKLSIILPTYNERKNIIPLIAVIKRMLDAREHDYEIVVVDDNSPDGTGEAVKEFSGKHKDVKCIIRSDEKGLATAIEKGIRNARGALILIMDTDFSHTPRTIPRLIKAIEDSDVAVASRYIKNGSMRAPWYKYIGSFLMNKVINAILNLGVSDSTGGFIIFRRKDIEGLDMDKIFSGYGEYCFKLLYALRAKGRKIKEIPFRYGIRRHGRTKSNLVSMGVMYLFEAFRTRLAA